MLASYEKTDNLGEKGILSIILVPFPAPSHKMELAALLMGEKLIGKGRRVTFCVAEINSG